MAEHEEKNFEHEFAEMFKKLDEEIKIPEIPDAQSVFMKAEIQNSNTVPFKKYSKYVAAAAAVVLICAGVPFVAKAASAEISLDNIEPEAVEEPMAAPDSDIECYFTDNTKSNSGEPIPEEPGEPAYVAEKEIVESEEQKNQDGTNAVVEKPMDGISVKDVLYRFFEDNPPGNPSTGGSGEVRSIEEYINKKRTVEITIESGSVSVLVRDNSANEEMINAFWVEGSYESSYYDGKYYVIDLSKKIYPEEIENEYYLPMVGDAEGTRTIPEENIFVPEEVKEGIISLSVEIDVGTGEYWIYASLV